MRWMELIDAFLSPLGFGVALAFVMWRWHARFSRRLWRTAIAAEFLCLVLTTPLGANVLVSWQERRTPQPAACAAPEPRAIVLLSGGMRRDAADAGDFDVLNAASLQRTLAAARLAKRIPDAELVIAGGARNGSGVAQSQIMAQVAEGFGVPASSIRTEALSSTTWENATRVHALEPALPSRIWLVTSALHLPRALVAFRAAGFEPCAYSGDFRSAPFDGLVDLLPSAGAIANTDAVLHEIVGEIVYRVRATL